jgi:DNA-binding transcriptional LysR family regulator
MLDPDHDIFVAIVAAGSLSAAGRNLGLSPAMVSKRLARLESRLGARLLHRSTRRMAMTARGERLHEDLCGIIVALGEAEARVRGDPGQPGGQLRVSAPTSFGRMHLAPYIAGFLALYPRVELTLDLSDDYIDLHASRVDVAIRITADIPAGLVAHRLATSDRALCASPAYLAEHGAPRTVAQLAGHRLLAASGQLPWRLSGPEGEIVIEGASHVRTNSSEVVRELAIAGAGIALRSLWDVNPALESGALHRILPHISGSRDLAIYAVHPPAVGPDATLACFLDFLRDLYGEAPPIGSQRLFASVMLQMV